MTGHVHAYRQLSRDSAVPLYQQIKQLLLEDIRTGVLEPHARLLSERKLVDQFGVSRITVRQALGELVQQGVLYTKPAKGFFVAERSPPYDLNVLLSFTAAARERGLVPGSRILQAGVIPASSALARQLLVEPGAEVVSLSRVRLVDGIPVMVVHSWLPHVLCPGILERDLQHGSLYATLFEEHGLVLSQAQATISARLASAQEQKWLELTELDAVVTVEQLTCAQGGEPVELSTLIVHPQRYPLSLVQTNEGFALGPAREGLDRESMPEPMQ
jgi:GntR family transcriptional regulator